ncbi:MAG: GNAT family N-acetyltransferase [Aquiluna sp.]|nr:GNAT family N-acetyltransferase [Aquiluna sp.]MCF8545518.1 GNAT family N-acetyltransferase [Aquiluna sp.]
MLEFRQAQEVDCEVVADLMNAHNLSVDSKASRVDNDSALSFINGYFEPNAAMLLTQDGFSGLVAAVNLNPDSHRQRFQIELFCSPEFIQVEKILDWIIETVRSTNPTWEIWPGANAKDMRLIDAWTKLGLSITRRFSVMRLDLSGFETSEVRDDVSIAAIDTNNEPQLRSWHSLHQDAFANHFGFTPRPFDEWIQMVTRDPSFDPGGVLVASVQGEPVGFCHHTDEFSSDDRGFIIGLGVAQSAQGRGYGEALLKAGAAYAIARGYTSLELAVDSGNESGALDLYAKVGFEITAAWVHLSKPS